MTMTSCLRIVRLVVRPSVAVGNRLLLLPRLFTRLLRLLVPLLIRSWFRTSSTLPLVSRLALARLVVASWTTRV